MKYAPGSYPLTISSFRYLLSSLNVLYRCPILMHGRNTISPIANEDKIEYFTPKRYIKNIPRPAVLRNRILMEFTSYNAGGNFQEKCSGNISGISRHFNILFIYQVKKRSPLIEMIPPI